MNIPPSSPLTKPHKTPGSLAAKTTAIVTTLLASTLILSGCSHNSADKSEENASIQGNVAMEKQLIYKGTPNPPSGWKVDKKNNELLSKDDGKCSAFLVNNINTTSEFRMGDDYRTQNSFESMTTSDEDIKDFTTDNYTANIAGTNLSFLSYDYKGEIATANKDNKKTLTLVHNPGQVHILLRSFEVKDGIADNKQLTYQTIGLKLTCKTGDQGSLATQAQDILNAFVFTKASDASASENTADSSDSASPSDNS